MEQGAQKLAQTSPSENLFNRIANGENINISDLLQLNIEQIASIGKLTLLKLNSTQIKNLCKIVSGQIMIYKELLGIRMKTGGLALKIISFLSKDENVLFEKIFKPNEQETIRKLMEWHFKLLEARKMIECFDCPNKDQVIQDANL